MTLSVGDKVVKLGSSGEPIKDGEAYVEYEVADVGGHVTLRTPSAANEDREDVYLMTLLRVVR